MKNFIGLDIGGTKISGIVFNSGNIVRELEIATPKNLFEFERNIIKLCDFLSAKEKISAVGVGMAGLVDSQKGIINYSPNIKFVKSLNLVKLFKQKGYKKIKIDNDANCFTRAELVLGQGKKFDNFLTLTLGTGVGGGIVINRKIYRGQNNMGGELGFTVFGQQSLEKLFQKTRQTDDYKEMGVLLGKQFATLVNIFAPQAIILGGGVSRNAGSKFLPGAKKEMKKYFLNQKTEIQILVSKLKNAGALGAALLVS